MDGSASHIISTLDELAALYEKPNERVVQKEIDYVNAAGRAFIAAAPFLVLATSGAAGLDCSPKGDKPGFVTVSEDGKTLFIPDRPGNNRIDGMKNLIEDPRIGLIFFAPGANETYRVNGRAKISVDPQLKRRFAVAGKEPRSVMVVAVEQAFQHCPKALIRSDLWRTGKTRPNVPTLGQFAAARNPQLDSNAIDRDFARHVGDELY